MHVEILTEGVAKPRTYSIATVPDDDGGPPDGLLEFFIARHPHGRASGWLHAPERLGTEVTIHGPYGGFRLPKATAGPLLCLAGGTGLAPLLAITRRALAEGYRDPIRLILSVRDRSELFALDALHALARRKGRFSYLVTISRAAEVDPATGWRRGRITSWLADELPDLSSWHVLAAGPPAFVEACIAEVRALGATPERILTDSFTPTAE
jgi:CDP-4-dehydro-6-deoxyglucose reductase